MKVLAINGSPHENGSTYTAVTIVLKELEREGVETEIFHIGSGPVQGCTGCGGCRGSGGGCVHDDGVNVVREKLQGCDGILLAAPTYYGGIAGGAKCFFDRLFFSGAGVKGKVGAVVTVARRSGGVDTFHQLNSYLTLGGAVIAPTVYWNYIHGNNGEEVMRDGEGIAIMQNVGQTMAWLIKALSATKDSIPAPPISRNVWTNFIR